MERSVCESGGCMVRRPGHRGRCAETAEDRRAFGGSCVGLAWEFRGKNGVGRALAGLAASRGQSRPRERAYAAAFRWGRKARSLTVRAKRSAPPFPAQSERLSRLRSTQYRFSKYDAYGHRRTKISSLRNSSQTCVVEKLHYTRHSDLKVVAATATDRALRHRRSKTNPRSGASSTQSAYLQKALVSRHLPLSIP